MLAAFLTTTGCGRDQYTGKWKVTSITKNGAPIPSPTYEWFINIKKSGDAGGDHDVSFAAKGMMTIDHLGMRKVGDHLYLSYGPGAADTIVVSGDMLTMTNTGYDDAGTPEVTVFKAVHQ